MNVKSAVFELGFVGGVVFGPRPGGMPSRFGTERTLAASHHEINQVVVTSLIDYILNKNDLFVIVPKSDTCLRLAYITIPLLQSPRSAQPETGTHRAG